MFSLWMWFVLGGGSWFVCWWDGDVCGGVFVLNDPEDRGKQLYNGGHYITVCVCIGE